MILFTKQKQTHRHRQQTYGYQRGKMRRRRDELGVWDYRIHTTVEQMCKQQGPTV